MRVVVLVMMFVSMSVFLWMRVLMLMLVIVRFIMLVEELFPGQIFLAVDNHIDLGCGDSVAVHATDIQRGSDVQAANRFQQQLRRDPGRDERAQKHVAADPRKAVQISNSHEFLTSSPPRGGNFHHRELRPWGQSKAGQPQGLASVQGAQSPVFVEHREEQHRRPAGLPFIIAFAHDQ